MLRIDWLTNVMFILIVDILSMMVWQACVIFTVWNFEWTIFAILLACADWIIKHNCPSPDDAVLTLFWFQAQSHNLWGPNLFQMKQKIYMLLHDSAIIRPTQCVLIAKEFNPNKKGQTSFKCLKVLFFCVLYREKEEVKMSRLRFIRESF